MENINLGGNVNVIRYVVGTLQKYAVDYLEIASMPQVCLL